MTILSGRIPKYTFSKQTMIDPLQVKINVQVGSIAFITKKIKDS